jgi:hypothetical protein
VRARPQRILIERGGLRAEVDPVNLGVIGRLLDETRPPADDDEAGDTSYDVVLDYGDRSERLRYDEGELDDDVRAALDARLDAAR